MASLVNYNPLETTKALGQRESAMYRHFDNFQTRIFSGGDVIPGQGVNETHYLRALSFLNTFDHVLVLEYLTEDLPALAESLGWRAVPSQAEGRKAKKWFRFMSPVHEFLLGLNYWDIKLYNYFRSKRLRNRQQNSCTKDATDCKMRA